MSSLRQLLVLGLLSILFLALSQSVKAAAPINIQIPGPYTALAVVFMQDMADTTCIVNLKLTSPSTQDIFINQSEEGMSNQVYLGQLSAGTSLVFEMSLSGTHPACAGTFYSNTDPKAVRIPIPMPEFMIIEWEIGDSSDGLALMIGIFLDAEPLQHPVVFIHGLGGHPQDWIDGNKRVYFDTLKSDPYNYPSDFLAAYAYSDADGNPATYDNQGDIALISQGLRGVVDDLAEKYSSGCSSDCVDLVGFSLGGMVIRQYLNDYPFTHKIRKAITIGSPHRGAWLLHLEDWLDSLGFPKGSLRQNLRSSLSDLISFLGIANVNVNSAAVQQIRPASDYLALLNSISIDSTRYEAFYGQIDAKFTLKLFFFELGKTFDIGDGLITSASAQGIPSANLATHAFSDPAIIELEGRLTKSGSDYVYIVDILGTEDWKYYHTNLIRQPDVVQEVTSLLTD